jgi:hypothetical protein
MTSQNIFLNISEIASFICQNKWSTSETFSRLWKKYDKEYDTCLLELDNEISKKNIDLILISNEKRILEENLEKGTITKREFTKSLKENDVKKTKIEKNITQITEKVDDISLTQTQKIEKDLGQDITKTIACNSKDTNDKRKITNDAIDKLVKTGKIKDEQKQELLKQTESLINKTHGTLKEDSAIKIFESQNKIVLDTSQKYYKYLVTNKNNCNWYIGGKMDGLYIDNNNINNNYVVEVKNRVKGFFSSLREYELIQIQLYLLLSGYNNAKLVEKYNTKIRVTDIKKDEIYINNIFEYLNIFITNFIKFLSNNNMKMDYIMLGENDKYKFLEKLYLKEISKLRKTKEELKVIETQTEEDCLLDDLDDF